MESNYIFYAIALLAVIIVLGVVKKITSCVVKLVILAVVLAVLGYVWLTYFSV